MNKEKQTMRVSSNHEGRSNRERRGGFTLMELLLVMAILVILLGLVAPRFINTSKEASISAARSQIGLFRGPLDMYALNLNGYPTTEQSLLSLVEAPEDLDDDTRWKGAYVDEIPQDPWGNDYQYEYPSDRMEKDFPAIWSYGPDGEDDTEDDIGNWPEEESSDEA
jgi:general secretion pathway protein G